MWDKVVYVIFMFGENLERKGRVWESGVLWEFCKRMER
jgi:hypothetical protein